MTMQSHAHTPRTTITDNLSPRSARTHLDELNSLTFSIWYVTEYGAWLFFRVTVTDTFGDGVLKLKPSAFAALTSASSSGDDARYMTSPRES